MKPLLLIAALFGQLQNHTGEPHPKVTPQVAVPEAHEISAETQSLYTKVHDLQTQAQVLDLQLENTKRLLSQANQALAMPLVRLSRRIADGIGQAVIDCFQAVGFHFVHD